MDSNFTSDAVPLASETCPHFLVPNQLDALGRGPNYVMKFLWCKLVALERWSYYEG